MGGTQFNGLALLWELARQGHNVTVLNRGKTEADIPVGVARLIGDRTDAASIRTALAGKEFDCVFDVTAYRPADVELMVDIFKGRTGHYIFISSTVIYGEADVLPITEDHPVDRSAAQNEYGMNKLICEDYLLRQHRESGFPATIVALSMVFGPRNILPDREQRMFARLLAGRRILIPGDGRRLGQIGHVEDQPQTFGKRYNLTGGDAFTAEGYVDIFANVVGVEVEKVFIPGPLMEDLWDGRRSVQSTEMNLKVDTRLDLRQDETERVRWQLSFLIQHLAPHINRWNRSVVFGVDRLRRTSAGNPGSPSRPLSSIPTTGTGAKVFTKRRSSISDSRISYSSWWTTGLGFDASPRRSDC